MTEDEAKTKWCPMVRVANGGSAGFNRNSIGTLRHIEAETHCIGSACMMWRDMFDDQPHASDATRRVRGYCGMAGKP